MSSQVPGLISQLLKCLLSPDELRLARDLDREMSSTDTGTKELQKDSMKLEKCQTAVDFLPTSAPDTLAYSSHLDYDYWKDELGVGERGRKLCTSFHFSSGVTKVQRGHESQLTASEKRARACLKKEKTVAQDEQVKAMVTTRKSMKQSVS